MCVYACAWCSSHSSRLCHTLKYVTISRYGLDPMAHRARIEGTLNELSSIDPNRRGYYDDVKSKYEWEWIISQAAAADSGLPAGALSMA